MLLMSKVNKLLLFFSILWIDQLTSAIRAEQCFQKRRGSVGDYDPWDTERIAFSDGDILKHIYVPGMAVGQIYACYDNSVRPAKLISLQPIVYEAGDDTFEG